MDSYSNFFSLSTRMIREKFLGKTDTPSVFNIIMEVI